MHNIICCSLKNDGNLKMSDNFRVREFKCSDGSDVILIDPMLVDILQKIRDHFKVSVNITKNGGYRTPTQNKKSGGAKYSQHMYGRAADIWVKGKSPQEVYNFINSIMPDYGGIGLYDSFVHVDTRPTKARWKG